MLGYTPQKTSRELVQAAELTSPSTIADFCAGNGSLILAAKERWPNARYFANDIDQSVLQAVPNVPWTAADFLSPSFEFEAPANLPEKIDLIVLNPPFSFERTYHSHARGKFSDIGCSVAFSFLFTSLNYLSEHGELLAVLPTSTLKSERDKDARNLLKRHFSLRMISKPTYDRFPGLDVSTYLLAIRHKTAQYHSLKTTQENFKDYSRFSIARGKISVRRSDRIESSSLHGWIHTTSIISSGIIIRYQLPEQHIVKDQQFIPSNSLIIPRVGRIQLGDIATSTRKEILSDCLLGVTFCDSRLSTLVMRGINRNFSSFREIYSGTGAPYTTHQKVSEFIQNLITEIVVVSDAS